MNRARKSRILIILPAVILFLAELCAASPLSEPSQAREIKAMASKAPAATSMKVFFDENAPGVVIVESNGERVRIDTKQKTFARDEANDQAPAPATEKDESDAVATKEIEKKEDSVKEVAAKASVTKEVASKESAVKESDSSKVNVPYDYHIVNIPTPKRVPRHSLNLYFTHRFQQPVKPLENSDDDLLGLDSFAVSSFGLTYGITDRLYANVYRSPLCQNGLCKTIEIGLGYHLLDEAGRSPVALSTYASVEGDDNFQRRFTYNIQAMVGRSVTRYVNLFFSPAVHINANGNGRFNPRPEDSFPGQFDNNFRLGTHGASFGLGVNASIRPTVSLLFEYTPRVGFKLGRVRSEFDSDFNFIRFINDSEPEIGFGIEKRIGRHVFSLTFSNTQATTTSRYNSSNLVLPPKRFSIGFNLFRRLL